MGSRAVVEEVNQLFDSRGLVGIDAFPLRVPGSGSEIMVTLQGELLEGVFTDDIDKELREKCSRAGTELSYVKSGREFAPYY